MRGRVHSLAAIVGTIVGLQIAVGGAASADDGPILVADSKNVTLTAVDAGGATATVTIENQAVGSMDVWAIVDDEDADEDCTITSPTEDKPTKVDGHLQQKVTITFAEACEPDLKGGTGFELHAGSATFDLHADPPKSPNPNWFAVLLIYGLAGVASALVLAIAWGNWKKPATRSVKQELSMVLPGLDATWKFSDSWAANATVVTAAFSGVFGAKEVTNALLGESEATTLLSVALVSAALALGLVGVSPMLLQGLRKRLEAEEGVVGAAVKAIPPGLYVTARGLVFAAFFTLTATVGQLATLLFGLSETDFGSETVIGSVGAIAGFLIFWYAYKATKQNLTTGAAPPPADPPAGGKTISITLPAPGGWRDLHVDGNRDEDEVNEDRRVIIVNVPVVDSTGVARSSGII